MSVQVNVHGGNGEKAIRDLKRKMQRELVFRQIKMSRFYEPPSAKRVGEQEAQRIATESANIGTVMHKSLERHVLGQDRTPGTNLIQQKAHAMANVIIEHGLKGVTEVWGSEINLYYPELYAGTTDLVGVYNGAPFIGDFKQARKLKKKEWVQDYFLQLTAYAEAHNKLFGTRIRTGRIFICTQANEFQTFEIDDYDRWSDQWYRRVEQYYKSVL